jgi:antitoxin PrlF
MNAYSTIENETLVNMTSKGQVLIPKAVRDRNGLMPNGPVRVGINDRGETVILPANKRELETVEERKTRIRAALEAATGIICLDGMTTDEYMQELRGDWQP